MMLRSWASSFSDIGLAKPWVRHNCSAAFKHFQALQAHRARCHGCRCEARMLARGRGLPGLLPPVSHPVEVGAPLAHDEAGMPPDLYGGPSRTPMSDLEIVEVTAGKRS